MRRCAFTLRELVVVLAIIAVLLAIVLIGLDRMRYESRVAKDMQQVRGIHQGLTMWAQSGYDEYFLPSRVDRRNTTVPEEGAAKDTTANIMSFLVGQGILTPDYLVSPLEANPAIRPIRNYRYELVERGEQGYTHFWDPAFSADFTAPGGGHVSYAHIPPVGQRRARWANTFVADEVILGTRGPLITGVRDASETHASPLFASEESLTYRLFRPRRAWSGHVAFNDNRVEHVSTLHAGIYRGAGRIGVQGPRIADLLHYDEPDDPSGMNHYLGIFIKAGERPEDMQAIWD